MKTYRVWLAKTHGNYGSAILVNAKNPEDARKQATEYTDKGIVQIEYLPKPVK